MAQVARVFGAWGWSRAASTTCGTPSRGRSPWSDGVPASTRGAAANPFCVFTSMLVPGIRRFFDADLERGSTRFLGAASSSRRSS